MDEGYTLGETSESDRLFALLNAGLAAGVNVGLQQIGSTQQIYSPAVSYTPAAAASSGMGLLLLGGLAYLIFK